MNDPLFAPRAARDLRAASLYIARRYRAAAMDFLNAATASARRLVENPYLGRTRLDLAPARYRFWSLTDFSMLLVYDAGQAPIVILRVVHTARDLPALLMGLSLD